MTQAHRGPHGDRSHRPRTGNKGAMVRAGANFTGDYPTVPTLTLHRAYGPGAFRMAHDREREGE